MEKRIEPINIYNACTEKPPELDFVLPGLLRGTVGSIVAPGGTGKSFLALEIAILIASKGKVNLLNMDLPNSITYKDEKTPVLCSYLSIEDPEVIIQHRLYSIAQYFKTDDVFKISNTLKTYSLSGCSPYIIDKDGNRNEEWISIFKQLCTGKALVFIDTLSLIHAVEENDNSLMKLVIDVLKEIATETYCSIVFLHHSNKLSMMQGKGDEQQASRGAACLVDNIRWQINLKTMHKTEVANYKNIDNYKNYLQLCGAKVNYSRSMDNEDEIWFKRLDGGVLHAIRMERAEGGENGRNAK